MHYYYVYNVRSSNQYITIYQVVRLMFTNDMNTQWRPQEYLYEDEIYKFTILSIDGGERAIAHPMKKSWNRKIFISYSVYNIYFFMISFPLNICIHRSVKTYFRKNSQTHTHTHKQWRNNFKISLYMQILQIYIYYHSCRVKKG